MILYSWKKVYKESKGNAKRILKIIEYITYKPLPNNLNDPVYNLSRVNWSGHSFLLWPEALFEYGKYYTTTELAEYVGLASFRSYAMYKTNQTITLDLLLCPLEQDKLKQNRLLKISDGKIKFCWEEAAKWRKKYGSV